MKRRVKDWRVGGTACALLDVKQFSFRALKVNTDAAE